MFTEPVNCCISFKLSPNWFDPLTYINDDDTYVTNN